LKSLVLKLAIFSCRGRVRASRMDFRRAGSGSTAPGIGLACAPRRSDAPPSSARVQNRLRELQALCSPDCEALLFVAGTVSAGVLLCAFASEHLQVPPYSIGRQEISCLCAPFRAMRREMLAGHNVTGIALLECRRHDGSCCKDSGSHASS